MHRMLNACQGVNTHCCAPSKQLCCNRTYPHMYVPIFSQPAPSGLFLSYPPRLTLKCRNLNKQLVGLLFEPRETVALGHTAYRLKPRFPI